MRTKIKYLIFSLLPLLLLFVALEGFFRLAGMGKPFTATLEMWDAPLEVQQADPYTTFRLRPNIQIGSINLNSLGYRDDELNHAAAVKILCLGDSVAFGWGIHDQRNTYAAQLEKILTEKGAAKHLTVEVFNAGIPSYQLYQGFQLYLHYLVPLEKWDYVICSLAWNEDKNTNDETEVSEMEYIRRNPPGENAFLRVARKAAERLRTYNVLESLYTRLFFHEVLDDQYPYRRYEKLLKQFAKEVKSHNSKLILLSAQVREEDKKNSLGLPILKLNAVAQNVANGENVPYVDTDALFAQKSPGWYDPVHFDEKGHRLTAEALSQVIAGDLGLPHD